MMQLKPILIMVTINTITINQLFNFNLMTIQFLGLDPFKKIYRVG